MEVEPIEARRGQASQHDKGDLNMHMTRELHKN